MKSLSDWLDKYGASHQNIYNRMIHKICVPLIFISIYGILFSFPFPNKSMYFNWANIVYIVALNFWFRLDIKIGIGFLIFGFILAFIATSTWILWLQTSDRAMLRYSFIIFILSWIGQFIGHKIEGKKPSFLDDLKFLLIGPIWIFYPKK